MISISFLGAFKREIEANQGLASVFNQKNIEAIWGHLTEIYGQVAQIVTDIQSMKARIENLEDACSLDAALSGENIQYALEYFRQSFHGSLDYWQPLKIKISITEQFDELIVVLIDMAKKEIKKDMTMEERCKIVKVVGTFIKNKR
jgi:hypothetical protein